MAVTPEDFIKAAKKSRSASDPSLAFLADIARTMSTSVGDLTPRIRELHRDGMPFRRHRGGRLSQAEQRTKRLSETRLIPGLPAVVHYLDLRDDVVNAPLAKYLRRLNGLRSSTRSTKDVRTKIEDLIDRECHDRDRESTHELRLQTREATKALKRKDRKIEDLTKRHEREIRQQARDLAAKCEKEKRELEEKASPKTSTPKKAAKASTKKTSKASTKKTSKASTKKTAKTSTKKTAKASTKKTAKVPAEKTPKAPATKTPKVPATKTSKTSVDKAADTSAKEETGKASAKKTSKASAKKTSKKAREDREHSEGRTTSATGLSLKAFADIVKKAATSKRTKRFGDTKAFISSAYEVARDDSGLAGMSLDAFKSRLVEANRERLLTLNRADLVSAMDPLDVGASETTDGIAEFHFIQLDPPPAPKSTRRTAAKTRSPKSNESAPATNLRPGQVVRYKGRRRRFVIVRVEPNGRLHLQALSGGFRGSGPSAVPASDVELDPDQSLNFSGAQADKRRSAAIQSASIGLEPSVTRAMFERTGRLGLPELLELQREVGGNPKPISVEAFATAVQQTANTLPKPGRYDEDRVFIWSAWQAMRDQPGVTSLGAFKERLIEAHRKGLLVLARADLTTAMDPGLVERSETQYLNASFHFIQATTAAPDPPKPARTRSTAVPTAAAEKERPTETLPKIGRDDFEERRERRVDRLHERAQKLQASSDARYQSAKQTADRIPFGQPILVGHHSEKADRRRRDRMETNFRKSAEQAEEAKALQRRAKRAEADDSISSDDPHALEKLDERIAELEREHEKLRNANAEALKAGKPKPIPSATLSNSSANIRRLKQRREQMVEFAGQSRAPLSAADWTLSEDKEVNRVQLRTDNDRRATDEEKKLIRGKGFIWSRREKAWQRKANIGAWNQGQYLLNQLEKLARHQLADQDPRPEKEASSAKPPEARMQFVDVATGESVHPAPSTRTTSDGTAPTGKLVADLEGQEVEIDPEDLLQSPSGHPRDLRVPFDTEGPTDYEALARSQAKAPQAKASRNRGGRGGGRLRVTFDSASKAAKSFYEANEMFFDHVRDPWDGLRDWMDKVDVRVGKTSRKLSKTRTGESILGERHAEQAIQRALAYVFGRARRRRWDEVEWTLVDQLGEALLPYFEDPGPGTPSQRGLYWRPTTSASSPEELAQLPPDERERLMLAESADEVRLALHDLEEAYAANLKCISPKLREVVQRRIHEWRRWADDPTKIPAYACEPDPRSGGYQCNYPSVAGELRELQQACERAYDPDWAKPESRRGEPGFPDTSSGPDDPLTSPAKTSAKKTSKTEAERLKLIEDKKGTHYVGVHFRSDFLKTFERDFGRTFAELDNGDNWVGLLEMRRSLPQYSREMFDVGLEFVRRKRIFGLEAAEGRHRTPTPEELDSAIHEQGRTLMFVTRQDT